MAGIKGLPLAFVRHCDVHWHSKHSRNRKEKKKTGTEEDFGVVWYHKHEDIACVEFHLHLIAPGHEKPLIFNHEY